MLQSIRDRTQGWIASIIISLLILSFALWGIHSYFMGGSVSNVVAEVDGIDITKGQLSIAYERLRKQFQSQNNSNNELGSNIDASLKEKALQALINIQVLKQISLKQNYYISAVQVDSYLESMPEFQVDGQFSLIKFRQILASTMYTPIEFLELIKTSLLIEQPRLGTIFSSFSLPNEVNETISLVNQERDIDYVVIPNQYFLNLKVIILPEMIKKYYEQHQNEYKTPEQVSIEYIEINPQSLMNKVKVSDDELKNYYNENAKEAQPEPFEKVKEKIKDLYIHQKTQELFSEVREKLANLVYQYPESLEFASKELALPIKKTESFSIDKGLPGDISVNNKIREVAFSNDVLTLHNNSDIIQVNADTAVVIRIKTHSPSTLLPLETVQQQITEKLKTLEINKNAEQQISQIVKQLNAGINPQTAMKDYPISWNHIGFLPRHSTKVDSAILDTAFEMPKLKDSKVIYGMTKIPIGYAIIGLKSVHDGKSANSEEYDVYAEQAQNTQGLLEYNLYKISAMENAKIVNK